jgi:hypothetical protein
MAGKWYGTEKDPGSYPNELEQLMVDIRCADDRSVKAILRLNAGRDARPIPDQRRIFHLERCRDVERRE